MNKIISILLIIVLCSCTAEPVKTSDISSLPSATTASTARHFFIPNISVPEAQDIVDEQEDAILPRITRYLKQGIASWYGPRFHGRKTASGEIYDMYAMTAAHKTLPLSSYVRVTNLKNQRSVIVRINDDTAVDGGIVEHSLDIDWKIMKIVNMTAPARQLFACFAEAMLLEFEGWHTNFSWGRNQISIENMDKIGAVSVKHGFRPLIG